MQKKRMLTCPLNSPSRSSVGPRAPERMRAAREDKKRIRKRGRKRKEEEDRGQKAKEKKKGKEKGKRKKEKGNSEGREETFGAKRKTKNKKMPIYRSGWGVCLHSANFFTSPPDWSVCWRESVFVWLVLVLFSSKKQPKKFPSIFFPFFSSLPFPTASFT